MSYKGKSPIYDNITTKGSVSYKNLTTTPSNIQEGYSQIYFKNNRPFYLDDNGIERLLVNDLALSMSFPVGDRTDIGQPAYLYEEGFISEYRVRREIEDVENIAKDIVLPTESTSSHPTAIKGIEHDWLYPNIFSVVQSLDDRLFAYSMDSLSTTDLNISSDMYSCAYHQNDTSLRHLVYHKDGSLFYKPFSSEYIPEDEQFLVNVNNLSFLKIICFQTRNELSSNMGLREIALIYVDNGELFVSLLAFERKELDMYRSDLMEEWVQEFSDPFYMNNVRHVTIVKIIHTLKNDSYIFNNIKHIHVNRSNSNITCDLNIIVDTGLSDLLEFKYKFQDVNYDTNREIVFEGVTNSWYSKTADYFGSVGLVTGADIRYYSEGQTLFLPHTQYNFTSDIYGVTHMAKLDTISVIFTDYTAEVTLSKIGNEFISSYVLIKNNFVYNLEGSQFVFFGEINPRDINYEQYMNVIKTNVLFIDNNSLLNKISINHINNILPFKDSPRVVNLSGISSNRLIKPVTTDRFFISGEAAGQYRDIILNGATSTVILSGLTQVAYVLPIAETLPTNRIVVIYKNAGNIVCEVRTDDVVTRSFSNISSGDIKGVELISSTEQSSRFVVYTDLEVFHYTWQASAITLTNETYSAAAYGDDTVLDLSVGLDSFAFLTKNTTDNIINLHTISATEDYTISLGSFGLDVQSRLFSHSSGVFCLVGDSVRKKMVVLDNGCNIISSAQGNHLFPLNMITDTGWSNNSLKDIISGNKRYTLVYDEYVSHFKFIETQTTSYSAKGLKHDSPVMPNSNSKISKLVSRIVTDNTTDDLLYIDHTDGGVSDYSPILIATGDGDDVAFPSLTALSGGKSFLTYWTASNEICNIHIDGYVFTKEVSTDTIANIKGLVNYTPFNDVMQSIVWTEDSVHVVQPDMTISSSLIMDYISSVKVLNFKTSTVILVLNNAKELYAYCYINNINGSLTPRYNTLVESNVDSFLVDQTRTHIGVVLVKSLNTSKMFSVSINENQFDKIQEVDLDLNYTGISLAGYNGILTTHNTSRSFHIDDSGVFEMYSSFTNNIKLPYDHANTYNNNSVFIDSPRIAFVTHLNVNKFELFKRISVGRNDHLAAIVVSDSGFITSLYRTNQSYRMRKDLIIENVEIGQYIGVSQDGAQFGTGSQTLVSLKGGISSAHNSLTPNNTVLSDDGSIELGMAITQNDILLRSTDFNKVVRPIAISPSDNEVLLEKPLAMIAETSTHSLYGLNIVRRHFRVSKDSMFKEVVYEYTENPYSDNHTFTTNYWMQENETYYWQCRDENEIGMKSPWSIPHMFTLSLADEVYTPSIISPTEGYELTGVNVTLMSSPYDAVPVSNTHVNTDWELYEGDTLIWSSYNDANLTLISVPEGTLRLNRHYKARVRYEGIETGKSNFSEFVNFNTELSYGRLVVTTNTFPFINIYEHDVDQLLISNSNINLPSEGNKISISGDGNLIATTYNQPPYTTLLKKGVNSKWSTINLNTPLTGSAYESSIEGDVVSYIHNNAPYLSVYKREGESFLNKMDLNDAVYSNCTCLDSSSDASVIAIGLNEAPFIKIYHRVGDVWEQSIINYTVTSTPNCVTVSSDGGLIIFGVSTEEVMIPLRRFSGEYSNVNVIDEIPFAPITDIDISPDDQHIAVTMSVFPYVRTYSYSELLEVFVIENTLSQSPTGPATAVKFSKPEVKYMAVSHSNFPYVISYKWVNDRWSPVVLIDEAPSGDGRGVAYFADED